ncbi:MAG: hypothetical protein O2805_07720 [Proteobacteria bacterium]|nr:hypothetical protein [Pseudomonadota bacterium]
MLSEIRALLTGALNSCEFLVPMPLEYEDGLYVGNCYSLVGTRTLFRQVPVKSLVPMEKGYIHILHEGQRKPIKLLPLVRLGASPETQKNSCYFYNRIDGGNARYVSYQYSDKSEEFVPAGALQPLFDLLGFSD